MIPTVEGVWEFDQLGVGWWEIVGDGCVSCGYTAQFTDDLMGSEPIGDRFLPFEVAGGE
jgi:hypothetical protein